jgi:hypothetical protein
MSQRRLVNQEDAVVDYAGQDAAEERADPVNAVVAPVVGDDGRAESAGGIQGGVSERIAEQGVHGDCEADAEAGNFVEGSPNVDHRREKNKDEEKRHDAFQEHGMEARKIRRERGIDRGHGFGTPCGVGNDCREKIGGGNCTEQLRGPVENCQGGSETFGDPETDGDCGIQVAARDVRDGGDHHADGDPVDKRDAEYGYCALTVGAQIFVGADCAHREEHNREAADEFREKSLGQGVHPSLQQSPELLFRGIEI